MAFVIVFVAQFFSNDNKPSKKKKTSNIKNVHVHHNLPRIEINDSLIHEVLQG